MSKKRKREYTEIDLQLVEVYEQLADEDVSRRLQAAGKLVSTIYRPDSTSIDQTRSILTRLFRGLCSSRKAARHGFAIALTELLSQIPVSLEPAKELTLSVSNVLDIYEAQTTLDGDVSGQEERDYYFGRLFGADAIIKSELIIKSADHKQWHRLLETICIIANKKPWLRQECGWILYQFVSSTEQKSSEAFATEILNALAEHKLVRSPEGVAIWVTTASKFTNVKLPKHIWKYGDPLALKDVKFLADILKNARQQSETSNDGFEAQGAATWSAKLHFVWDVVMSEFFHTHRHSSTTTNGFSDIRPSFEQFWKVVVDEGLFSTNSSTERKHTGLLVWGKTLESAPKPYLPFVLTKNALHVLVTTIRGDDAYLKKHARKVLQLIPLHTAPTLEDTADATVLSQCMVALIEAMDFSDFDQLTKSKTIETMIESSVPSSSSMVGSMLMTRFTTCKSDDSKVTAQRQRYFLILQAHLFTACLGHPEVIVIQQAQDFNLKESVLATLLKFWFSMANYTEETLPEIKILCRERFAAGLAQALRKGSIGHELIVATTNHILETQEQETQNVFKFDKRVQKLIEKTSKKLRRASKAAKSYHSENQTSRSENPKTHMNVEEGVMLLYRVVLLEVFNGEAEAVEILEDLIAQDELLSTKTKSLNSADRGNTMESLIEVLLSFASRPSKFMRRISTLVFESLTPQLNVSSLRSLTRILATKEDTKGQQEMFEAEQITNGMSEESESSEHTENNEDEDELDDSSTGSDENSDVDMVDSDVELVSAEDSPSSSSNEESDDDDQDSTPEDDEDDELAAFDAALASALGTRTAQDNLEDPDASDSDEDMNDDEMLALDSKLTEVFKARKAATSKKKENKDAKENIINFKNRVLDLIEIYLKREHLNPLSLELVLPLLETIRTTQTKQIADRTCNILREYCARCKGQNVPRLESGNVSNQKITIQLLRAIHDEACLETSNAHSAAASQASILLVKTLLHTSVGIRQAIDIYSDTRERQLTDKNCHVQPGFFTDWNNWCTSAKSQITTKKK